VPTSDRYVCFRLAGQELALPIGDVKETIRPRPVTPVFRTPPFVLGLINLRGEVVSVLDVARLLALRPTVVGPETRVLVVQRGPKAGILVDSLSEVRTLAEDSIRPPPATLDREVATFLRGVVSLEAGPVSILDLEHVFDAEALRPFRRAS
jgi:purine-binding chemotaxis protein CheW